MSLKQTPSQTVGPYFAYGLTPGQYNYPLTEIANGDMADDKVTGEQICFMGQVFDGEGVVIPDAMIEIWQADAMGQYVSAEIAASNTGFSGFGRFGTGTDPENHFIFNTVKPGSCEAGAAPHINIIVFMRGILTHAYTRAYFSDETEANRQDPVLASVPADRRATLIAERQEQDGKVSYRLDIHMQGNGETVFFDV
jgi:protocatechuate 3,4-dioxygenase alpha subunit